MMRGARRSNTTELMRATPMVRPKTRAQRATTSSRDTGETTNQHGRRRARDDELMTSVGTTHMRSRPFLVSTMS